MKPTWPSERAKAYVDAVVAIAMTLLILPLMESIGDAAAENVTAAEWFAEHGQQLISFVLSFAVIAMFWIRHHQLFAKVERISNALLWITVGWMLTVVWLPVATAITGQMESDPVSESNYIGTMAAAALLLLVTRVHLRRHSDLHEITPDALRRGIFVDFTMTLLFLCALLVAIVLPSVSYFALFLLMLVAPITRALLRLPILRSAEG